MTATLFRSTPRTRLLSELEHPREMFAAITPNWYASVMGTGIVGVAAASLPIQFPGLRFVATAVWALAAVLLVFLTAATVTHWVLYRDRARAHHADPVMAHFYGAPPMALLTVGAGTLLLGKDVIGLRAAVDLDWALWFAGTITGLVAAGVIPYLMFVRPTRTVEHRAFGGWLMPVVPPMVSASTGALLVPHAPDGSARLTLLIACYAMFALSLVASLVVIVPVWRRLARRETDEARLVPTLWIVLGPLGQSVTAVNLLGGVAAQTVPAPYATALQVFGVLYGVPVLGVAALWACLAGAVTVRTIRTGLPFSLTWWSFTFPVGTCVTGTSALALHTGSDVFRYAAPGLYGCLVAAWVVVATRTLRASARGTLFVAAGATPRVSVPGYAAPGRR